MVDGDRSLATLDYLRPLTILDAASGETRAVVAETAPARQVLVSDGVAVVYSQVANPAMTKCRGKVQTGGDPGTLTAVDSATGAVLWRHNVTGLRDVLLALDHGRVLYQASKQLIALDLRTGKELWQTEPQETDVRTLVACDGVVVLRGQKAVEVRDVAAGTLLWHKPALPSISPSNEDLFVIRGVVWPEWPPWTNTGQAVH